MSSRGGSGSRSNRPRAGSHLYMASFADPSGSHPPWFADSEQRNAFFLADWQGTGGLTEYLNNYNRWPDPAPLPNYVPPPIGTRWDNEPIPPMLAFTENAVAYATELDRMEGDDRVANFHSTGVHVDASARYVNWLDDEGRKRGSLDFMLRQGMHSLGLLPLCSKAFSDAQARSRWLYKPRHVPEEPTDKQEPMDVDVPATQEDDDEDDVPVGSRRRARQIVTEDEEEDDEDARPSKRHRYSESVDGRRSKARRDSEQSDEEQEMIAVETGARQEDSRRSSRTAQDDDKEEDRGQDSPRRKLRHHQDFSAPPAASIPHLDLTQLGKSAKPSRLRGFNGRVIPSLAVSRTRRTPFTRNDDEGMLLVFIPDSEEDMPAPRQASHGTALKRFNLHISAPPRRRNLPDLLQACRSDARVSQQTVSGSDVGSSTSTRDPSPGASSIRATSATPSSALPDFDQKMGDDTDVHGGKGALQGSEQDAFAQETQTSANSRLSNGSDTPGFDWPDFLADRAKKDETPPAKKTHSSRGRTRSPTKTTPARGKAVRTKTARSRGTAVQTQSSSRLSLPWLDALFSQKALTLLRADLFAHHGPTPSFTWLDAVLPHLSSLPQTPSPETVSYLRNLIPNASHLKETLTTMGYTISHRNPDNTIDDIYGALAAHVTYWIRNII
ncbi:hypothetical protein BDZ89DRAFT_1144559 [Hymenopellis radicata]|nr:hypothetical protein BDZ89DRAFT_1144559 [Hymenopellis radicata]